MWTWNRTEAGSGAVVEAKTRGTAQPYIQIYSRYVSNTANIFLQLVVVSHCQLIVPPEMFRVLPPFRVFNNCYAEHTWVLLRAMLSLLVTEVICLQHIQRFNL